MAVLLRLYRAAIVVAVALLIHQQARWLEAHRRYPVTLAQARLFFPNADGLQLRDAQRGFYYATDARRNVLGVLLTTSPDADDIIGYAGPNNLLVALDRNGAIAGVEIIKAGDTPEHVELVRKSRDFFRQFVGWKPSQAKAPHVDGVAGATLTSYAMAEAVQKRLAGAAPSMRFSEPLSLAEVRDLFTNAASFSAEGRRLRVLAEDGNLVGYVVRTSPEGDNVAGYRGPSEVVAAIDADGQTVRRVRLRKSYDTASYVERVREDESYLQSFEGRTVDELAKLDFKREKIEGVSGATQTSFAIAESLKRRFASEQNTQDRRGEWKLKGRDWGLGAVVAGAFVMAFTRLRGMRWVRIAWQAVLIGYVGVAVGGLLSISLLGGWATNGLAARAAPGLVLLAAVALLVPLITRRQIYCHQICPHGAVQGWLGWLKRRNQRSEIRNPKGGPTPKPESAVEGRESSGEGQNHPSPLPSPRGGEREKASDGFERAAESRRNRVTRVFELLPGALLVFAVFALVMQWRMDLSQIEPFDAWIWRTATIATVGIMVVGFVAAIFIPQAYCRFGCPTGALLNFVRSPGSGDRWGARDTCAAVVLGVALMVVAESRSSPRAGSEHDSVLLQGHTMGTTWSVKIRGAVADRAELQKAIAAEYDRIEALTSHWRTNTPIGAFNQSRDTTEFPVSPEIVRLVRTSMEISKATAGAFDITIGPLMKVWGFGAASRRESPPEDGEISDMRMAVGYEQLAVTDTALRKMHPAVELDLSAIVPGYANDRIAELLGKRGLTNFLVESGGELRARGTWTIEIEHPSRTCTLSNEAIGTSGTYRQNWKAGDRTYSHLLDPHTGSPVTHNTVSVSVRMPDCAGADAWGAALNVLGVEAGLPLADKLGIAAQFVVQQADEALNVVESRAWPKSSDPATK